jgi:tetratricopeptide (TPR) repeat protein
MLLDDCHSVPVALVTKMPKNAEKAQKAKEKKERKQLEAQMKQSREKVEEAKLLMDPTEPKVPPNFNKGIQALDAALQLWAENGDALRLRGDCHRENKNLDVAIDDYTAAIGIDENNLPALEGRATCYMAQRKWDAAATDFTKMIEVAPQHDHAYNMRATARLQKRAAGLRLRNAELAAVIEDFTKSLRLNPNNFHATCNLARCYDEHGMFQEAIDQYSSALRLKDEYSYAAYRRGVAALALVESRRDAKAAKRAKEEAARAANAADGGEPRAVEPENAEAEIQRLLDAEKRSETDSAEEQRLLTAAIEDFNRVIPAEDAQAELPCIIHRGACFALLSQFDRAQADFKIASAVLDPLKGADLAEVAFGGSSAAVLKEVLVIRKQQLADLQTKERKPSTAK